MRSSGTEAAGEAGAAATRRGVLAWVWGALGLAAVAELGWITAVFLRPRSPSAAATDALFVAGPVDAFAPGSVTAFPDGRFYLVRLADGGLLALHRECTHLGCTVPWREDEQRFACPCHASSFDLTGKVLSPPAPRPLDRYEVRVENGIVKVDTSRRLRQDPTAPPPAVQG